MADIRENLIEILRKTRYEYRRYIAMKDYEKRMAKTDEEFCAVDDSIVGEIPFCADHLIANCVTIQRWIPVEERLPEKQAQYICRYVFGEEESYPFYLILWYYAVDKNPHFQHEGSLGLRVTHWMPLPEAPEGQ